MKPLALIIVLPCFNEEEVLPETTRQLTALFMEMIQGGVISDASRILYVNDGSHDRTWDLISRYHEENPFVCGVNLAGNVGHQYALMAGLETAKDVGDLIVSIDADLQDDIQAIPEMVQKMSGGGQEWNLKTYEEVREERQSREAGSQNG